MSRVEDHSTESVAAGLDDARATIAEIWRRTDDDAGRARCMRALQAVIAAEKTMKAADTFMLADGRVDRQKAFEALRQSAILRLGHAVRSKP